MNAVAQLNQPGQTSHVLAGIAVQQDELQRRSSTGVSVKIHDGFAHIVLSGHFGFKMCRNFRNSYMHLLDNTAVHEIRVEMSKVDYMDSSALGMLLLLDERAKAANKSIMLLVTSGFVSRVFEFANFSSIFNIKHI
ncbi:MAG: STAS domain-containing protein [Gallionella sp.]|nr:STAS domain-containing protein [Gallionella sp.]